MAGDSAATSGYDVSLRPGSKVFYIGNRNFIVGCCGSPRATNVLRYKFTPPVPETDDIMSYMVTGFVEGMRESLKQAGHATKSDEVEWTGVQCLVGFNAKLFMVDTDYQVGEVVTGFEAIGAGADLALGALYATPTVTPKRRIATAMAAAAEFNSACKPPFDIHKANW